MKESNATFSGVGTTESMMKKQGYHQLNAKEIKEIVMSRKTISGDYLYDRSYVVAYNQDGTMEGRNDLGGYHIGKWSVDNDADTFTTSWDGWDNWSGRVYDVNGEIVFYDSTTLEWRTTLKKEDDGTIIL